jgi:hypothetical protein
MIGRCNWSGTVGTNCSIKAYIINLYRSWLNSISGINAFNRTAVTFSHQLTYAHPFDSLIVSVIIFLSINSRIRKLFEIQDMLAW